MMYRFIIALIAFLLCVGAPSASNAQPTQEPGQGELVQIGVATVGIGDGTVLVDDMARRGQVRGIRLLAKGGGVIISRVIIRYANGQVHYENREIVLADGEQTKLIDPRFEERNVRSVEVVLKAGRRSTAVTLEVLGAQSPSSLAETRVRSTSKKRSAKRSIEAARPPATSPDVVDKSNLPPTEPLGSGAPVARGPASVEPYTGVAIFYGTDRKNEVDRTMPDGRTLLSFGGEPSPDRRMSLGRAVVTIPKTRKPGTIGRPEISLIVRQIPTGDEDRSKHFTLLRVEGLEAGAFASAIKDHLGAAKKFREQAFVFIHGFNVSFDDAIFRAAQISHDMEFDGLPLVYSWPSAGRAEAYTLDRDQAVNSAENLVDFLNLVAQKSGARDIHLVAHSTGAFVLMQALKALERNPVPATNPKLGQIVFAAPDIIADNFKADAQRLRTMGKGMTLYASSSDWALWISGLLKTGRNPAGAIPRNGIPVLAAGVDSIDVSKLDTSYFALNHSTFGDHDTLIKDMGKLIAAGTRPPSNRDGQFRERSDPRGGGKFWRYEAR